MMKKLAALVTALMLCFTAVPVYADAIDVGEQMLFWQVLAFRLVGAELVSVNGNSMRETLQNGEVMLVTKYDYLAGDPQRFDVVVCHYPGRANLQFVKRVVGLPGDTVAMENGCLYINGEKCEEAYITNQANYRMKEYTVPEGQYFVLGDNRSNSNDSHIFGSIERKMIVGHVRRIVWPVEAMREVQ